MFEDIKNRERRVDSLQTLTDKIAEEYGNMVSAICRRMIQDQNLAEDVAQEAWIQIIKSIDSFKGKSKLSTWIYTICYRVIKKHCEKERIYTTEFLSYHFRYGRLEVPENIDYDHSIWVKEMCDKCLTGILHCLDNESRLIYLLRDVAQLEYEDIAIIINKKEATIRKLISRARKKLKNFLEDECILFNPYGKCNCRMKELVKNIELEDEYAKIRRMAVKVNFFLASEEVLPGKNFWEKYI
ncbi:sigma-70 family RNA polymerase sigma factor [Wukongibacter baidiensis]|uniref:RNA polymerase sigma factor n=1 Tax=Wukongibacter baidiensis TaxID=1723361 RepID=UPI003D7F6201